MKRKAPLIVFLLLGLIISGIDVAFAQNTKVKLNQSAFAYAQELITQGHVVCDKKNAWAGHHPGTAEENTFLRTHDFAEYAKWHLGIDETHTEHTKARYKFPFGDFKDIHRCALLAVKSRAHQFGYTDIETAAIRLIEMVNSKDENQSREHRGGRSLLQSNQESQLLKNASISSGRSSL